MSIGLSGPKTARDVARAVARSEVRVPGDGELYDACKVAYESVAGGGDGAFVAAPPHCAHPRAFVKFLYHFGTSHHCNPCSHFVG